MTDTQFMGMLIAAIVTLLGIASVIVAIIIKPIINLNRTIAKLDTTIEGIQRDSGTLKARVDKHGLELDDVRLSVTKHEETLKSHTSDIEMLKMRKAK